MMESAVTMGLVLGLGGLVGSVGSSGTVNEEAVVALVIVDVVEIGFPGCRVGSQWEHQERPPNLMLVLLRIRPVLLPLLTFK